jgi:DeoR/GlpR family transcriptional regulator of sugar metabolism
MSKREKKIVEIVHQQGNITINELSNLLGTSTSSIRRDLIALDNHRFINREHGRVSLSTIVNYEDRWFNRTPVDHNEARAIARKAVEFIQPGDIVGLSGGILCTQLAYLLRLINGITVVTNAVNIAAEFVYLPGVQVRLTGGRLNQGSFELVGRALESSLQGVHIQKFFLGTDGLSVEYGVTGHDEAEADAARYMMRHSNQTIVLADSTKFKKVSFAQVAPLNAFDMVVSTHLVPQNIRDEIEETGVQVEINSKEVMKDPS